jgi:hypothetical protein
MAKEEEPPKTFTHKIDNAGEEYRFASAVEVDRPAKMVYLDFIQIDPHSPEDKPRLKLVSRVVIHPDVVPSLIEQLSSVRDAE